MISNLRDDHCNCPVCDRLADAIYKSEETHFELVDRWKCACGYVPPTEYAGSLKGQMMWQHVTYEHFKAASAAYHASMAAGRQPADQRCDE